MCEHTVTHTHHVGWQSPRYHYYYLPSVTTFSIYHQHGWYGIIHSYNRIDVLESTSIIRSTLCDRCRTLFSFGILSLFAPHFFIAQLAGGSYNHAVHETLRYVLMLIHVIEKTNQLQKLSTVYFYFWNSSWFVTTNQRILIEWNNHEHIQTHIDYMPAYVLRLGIYYGMYVQLMMDCFDGMCVRHYSSVIYYKRWSYYVLNWPIDMYGSIG